MATLEELQARLDTLNEAISTGVLRVRDHDGSEVLYRSYDDMLRARADLESQIIGVTVPTTDYGFRSRRIRMGKGLC